METQPLICPDCGHEFIQGESVTIRTQGEGLIFSILCPNCDREIEAIKTEETEVS